VSVLVGSLSVVLWFGVLGHRLVFACWGSKSALRRHTFGLEIRNSPSSVRRQFGDNPEDFERKAWIADESRCDVQNVEALLSWCLGEHRPQPCEAKTMTKLSEYLHTAEAAEYLGVHHNTIRNWAARGEVPMHHNPVNGYRLFKRTDLDKLLKKAAKPVKPR
jgi:excisionase family DNA binding protein